MTILAILSVAALFFGNSNMVDAHGYTSISRGKLCKDGRNTNCGNIIYEPQSLEGTKGFPGAGPPDGKIASAGVPAFSPLDQQTSTRWQKTNVQAGSTSFQWTHTARHSTTGYQYFITKAGWNPNAPLTRAQFDSQPFCTVNSGGAPPGPTSSHTCNLPSRQGYHVILAVWTIADTPMAFYNVMDVNYSGSNTVTPPSGGGGTTTTSPGNLCGTSWQDAGKCGTRCPGGMNSECPSGESCYANISCSSSSGSGSGSTSKPPGNYCGRTGSWADAQKCQTACPKGMNSECPGGESCYASITCS